MAIKIIAMQSYGINTSVETTEERINWYLNEYATQPDMRFGGVGKKKLMKYTYECLLREDRYFSKHIQAALIEHQRWQDFLEDCIIYATLNYFLNGVPLQLLSEDDMTDFLSEADEVKVYFAMPDVQQ